MTWTKANILALVTNDSLPGTYRVHRGTGVPRHAGGGVVLDRQECDSTAVIVGAVVAVVAVIGLFLGIALAMRRRGRTSPAMAMASGSGAAGFGFGVPPDQPFGTGNGTYAAPVAASPGPLGPPQGWYRDPGRPRPDR